MKVSFVVPSHNAAAWLPHAIDSVYKQTYDDIELVIVNDGSTDSTRDFLDKFSDGKTHADAMELLKERFKDNLQIIHTEGIGRSAARNLGNKSAKGEIIFVLDADDYSSPDRVKKTLPKFKDGVEYVYGSAETMDFSGTRGFLLKADVFDKIKAMTTLMNGIVHSSVAYTKSLSKRYPYSELKEISDLGIDDWEHQLRLGLKGIKMDFVLTTVVAYRILESAVTQTRDPAKVKAFKDRYILEAMVPCA